MEVILPCGKAFVTVEAMKRTPVRQSSKKLKQLPRVLFVVGATSSGKTDFGVQVAQAFDGEIINADARQIYRQVSIGTGKPRGVSGLYKRRHRAFIHCSIPHYLMDFLPPSETYSAAEWRESAMKAVKGITKRKHLPIVVGGTGLYIAGLIDHLDFPNVPPQPVLRTAYEEKELDDLVRLLLHIDPEGGVEVDLCNKRRVVRALEMMTFTGKKMAELRKKGPPLVDALQIGIDRTREELFARADTAVDEMVSLGLANEVEILLKEGVSDSSPAFTALGYREIAMALRGEVSMEDAVEKIKKLTHAYIRRQWTWFKRDPRIVWVKDAKDGMKRVRSWLKNM